MTTEKAMYVLKERYTRFCDALAELPKEANVIGAALTLSGDASIDYIQLFRDGELPDGPAAIRRYEDGRREKRVQIAGVDVIWLLDWEEEAEP